MEFPAESEKMGFPDCRLRQSGAEEQQGGGRKAGPMQSQRRGRRLGEEARVRCCWQRGTHRAPPKGRSWWDWGAEARPKGLHRGAVLGRACMLPPRWLAPLQAHPAPYGLGTSSPSRGDDLPSAPHSALPTSLSPVCAQL